MLKALMLRKQIDDANNALNALKANDAELAKREAELANDIAEANTDEERAVVEEAVNAYEAEKAENDMAKDDLERKVADLEEELRKIEENDKPDEVQDERKENTEMEKVEMTDMEIQERAAFVDYVRGIANNGKVETRDSDYNMTQGNNGAIVPKSIAQEIITKVKEICPIYERATKYNVKGTLDVPFYPASADHVIAAAYVDELDELVASSGDFDKVTFNGFVAGALAIISKKLINNTDVDVVPFIVEQMAEAFRAFYEHEGLVGTASHATGLIAGITQLVTAGAKSSVTCDELIACQCKVPTAYQANCAWIMAPATFELIKKLKDGESRYILNPDVRYDFGYSLLGKPVFLSDNAPALGTTNNVAVIYGDLSGLGIKTTEELEIQVLNEKYATRHAVGVVGWTEIDTKVINAQKFAGIKCGSSDPQ